MRIAVIVNPLIAVPPERYGGIERIVFMLIQYLTNNGHAVTLYANENSDPGCQLIGYRESENYRLRDFVTINRLTVQILAGGFDLVHTFGRMSNIALLMFSKIPKVVSYQLPPTIKQVKRAVRIAPENSLYFTACSNYIAAQIKDYANVTTIFNGVNMNDYDHHDQLSVNAPLVFLGRIQAEKGTAIAIKVAMQTGNKLIIAGNIPGESLHQQYFKEQVEPFIDGKQISYIGPVNDQQKNILLNDARALLMPVTWDEPFGIVMAEALACGTPVIGFNRGAVAEIVTHGLNGFICETVEDMTAAVSQIEQIKRSECRKVAARYFSAEVTGAEYERLYRQIIS